MWNWIKERQFYLVCIVAGCLFISLITATFVMKDKSDTEPLLDYTQLVQEINQQQHEKTVLETELFNSNQWLESANYTIRQLNSEVERLSRTVMNCQANNDRLAADYGNLEGSWRETIKALAEITSEQKDLELSRAQAAYWKVELQAQLDAKTAQYNDVLARLKMVDDREDSTTTSNLTAEKRQAFYEMWDIWYEICF